MFLSNFILTTPTIILVGFFFLQDFYTNDAPLQFGGLQPGVVKTQDSAIERDLHLSLDDLFLGCTKKIKISRRVRATASQRTIFFHPSALEWLKLFSSPILTHTFPLCYNRCINILGHKDLSHD